jgi:GntR family transcriptional regulator
MLKVKVDRDEPVDLHEQVAAEIRRAIADGEAKPGERLPPAKDLAAVLGVNTNTVLRALRQHRDEGLLDFRRGRGIRVAGTPERALVVAEAKALVQLARRHGCTSRGCLAAATVLAATHDRAVQKAPPTPLEGAVARAPTSMRPTVRAAFLRESYSVNTMGRLRIFSSAHGVRLQILRAGTENRRIGVRDAMLGSPVTKTAWIGRVWSGRLITVRIGGWESGLYYARLVSRRGSIGHAPFVLRPRTLGTRRVAIVLPTQTWQAYNFSDDNGDGREDTWYAGGTTARTARPYENRGVPTNYRRYDQPFLCWLDATGREVDYLSQADLNRLRNGRLLARAYDLIVFPGHHEYVTEREYDAITNFRDAGGNLMFLSANNFFWKITRRGDVMTRIQQWRKLGRPEATLVGVQYFAGDRGGYKAPWVVRDQFAADGLLAAAGLRNTMRFGEGGVEVDATTRRSPAGIRVLAELRWRKRTFGQMTYYETGRGAEVFAAGSISLVTALYREDVRRVLEELWERLAGP